MAEPLGVEAPPLLASPPAPTFAPETGTAPLAIVEPTTSQAGLAASSVVLPRRTPPPPDLTPTFLELEAIALPAPLLLALLGNPATGYVLGLDAMSITLQIEWNAIDAMHQGTLLVLGLPIHPRLYLLHLACCGRRELMRSNPYSLLIVVIVFFSSSPSRYISIFASLIFSI
ncbi:uncharacterized protein DS421_8g249100 [Arachis hypogaea]|nr:uncharacterized protein DS421_8g249100 [Arachis hypogaea]